MGAPVFRHDSLHYILVREETHDRAAKVADNPRSRFPPPLDVPSFRPRRPREGQPHEGAGRPGCARAKKAKGFAAGGQALNPLQSLKKPRRGGVGLSSGVGC